jgi:hypothetical protein
VLAISTGFVNSYRTIELAGFCFVPALPPASSDSNDYRCQRPWTERSGCLWTSGLDFCVRILLLFNTANLTQLFAINCSMNVKIRSICGFVFSASDNQIPVNTKSLRRHQFNCRVDISENSRTVVSNYFMTKFVGLINVD